MSARDSRAWSEIRRRNVAWLAPWEATVPPGDRSAPQDFKALVRELHKQARDGRTLPFAVTVDGELAGQLTVTNITGGSARWG
ncbi:MAG: RimJ/RimL family protein N-acetyltransferase, partial [Nocardioidaceae bacterium]|nr:RimJ/RimL family protein N-acetyltransferase [Nocardioidaceae bacterium]